MKKMKYTFFNSALVLLSLVMVQCKDSGKENKEPMPTDTESSEKITKSNYGTTSEGETVEEFTLKNENGMEVKVITYGGIITSWTAPDKDGNYKDVVLGFDSLEDYQEENPYFGALIGRYGNRIAKGKFSLDGEDYELAQNDGENHLHGGQQGFDKVVWDAEALEGNSLKLTYTSEDGEEGYPGKLETTVIYTLNEDDSFDIEYSAETDKKTIVNLTQHTYFNLSGDFSEKILDHELEINADEFLPVDETLIPTGELRKVADTPFDFRESKEVGKEIEAENEQLELGKGYDHCWVLNEQDAGMRFAAAAHHKASGRYLEVHTDEPGIQFYSGNFLDGTRPQKTGEGNYEQRSGFCLETQHYPDSPNQPDFPSVVLEPGETYSSKTTFKFSVK